MKKKHPTVVLWLTEAPGPKRPDDHRSPISCCQDGLNTSRSEA
jgi:hypothetical protein